MDRKKEIGARLLQVRKDQPRKEVAKAVGISVSALQMYECGYRVPKDPIKVAISKYYGISVEALFYPDFNRDTA